MRNDFPISTLPDELLAKEEQGMESIRTIKTGIHDRLCRLKFELGQTTAEYALVLLAAATVAFVLIRWASQENSVLTAFFDAVIGNITGMMGGGG